MKDQQVRDAEKHRIVFEMVDPDSMLRVQVKLDTDSEALNRLKQNSSRYT
jgi:hypothetical protein